LSVDVQGSGASCHVGYRSCFYRSIDLKNGEVSLKFEEKEKVFDPEIVYKGKENPTKL
jgi:phosphoribosyl-AMP cyclohydrolase